MNAFHNWGHHLHQWKRPAERQRWDIEKIQEKLRSLKSLGKFSSDLLKDLARVSFYEELSRSIMFDAIQVDVLKEGCLVKRLTAGSLFGESTGPIEPHSCSAVISNDTELLRIEHKDFRYLWKRYSGSFKDTVVLLSHLVSKFLEARRTNNSESGSRSEVKPIIARKPEPRRFSQNRNATLHIGNRKSPQGNKTYTPEYSTSAHPDLENQLLHRQSYQAEEDLDSLECQMQNGGGPSFPLEYFPDIHEEPWSQSPPPPEIHFNNFLPQDSPVFSRRDLGLPYGSQPDHPVVNKRLYAEEDSLHLFPISRTAVIESGMESRLFHCGRVLRAVMLLRAPHLIRDRKLQAAFYRRCMLGSEMVDWIMVQNHPSISTTRIQAVGMWQALLEEGILMHVSHEYAFADKCLYYRWNVDEGVPGQVVKFPSLEEQHEAEMELGSALSYLSTIGPDASFRMILHKQPQERSGEEVEVVYEEVLHVKALSHLSTMVKRELASVLVLEHHSHAGNVLFNQGDEGKSWYIILKGSVNVIIYGKGVVCTLHEGDDFGKLALVNNAPRAASIIMREDNCQFLRVDKHDFNRILRDVEANTVRLKEHGEDVLVLEKIPVHHPSLAHGSHHHRYSVMAGTPEKMLEYLLETRMDSHRDDGAADTFLEDFILTHPIFLPSNILCNSLTLYYQQGCSVAGPKISLGAFQFHSRQNQLLEQEVVFKKRVVNFLKTWISLTGHTFFQDPIGAAFVEELYCLVVEDSSSYVGLEGEVEKIEGLKEEKEKAMQLTTRGCRVVVDCGVLRSDAPAPVLPFDVCIFNVHSVDGSYITMKMGVSKSVREIVDAATQKLGLGPDGTVELVEVKSNGERRVFHPNDVSVPTMATLNGTFFLCFTDQIDALMSLPEQRGPAVSVHSGTLEVLSSSELSFHLAAFHWELFLQTPESELVYQVVGRDRFPGKTPTNLDLLIRRFTEVQFWVVTEILLCPGIAKRVHILKKFIKIAAQAKVYQDLLGFFAVVLGLSNVAVSRLNHTWDKLPAKFRKQLAEFESLLDPSRNHRAYRLMVSKLHPPVIPFLPLMLKDLTFTHEGNKTYFDGLVNFEKMYMMSQTLRTFRKFKAKHFEMENFAFRNSAEAQQLVRNFKVIDNQLTLMELSQKLEPGRSKHVR